MATTPSVTPTFQPAFKRVAQSCEFDCAFACCAILSGQSLEEIRAIAVQKFDHPAANRAYWITESLIQRLLADRGLVATHYKEFTSIADLPEVAILLIDYSEETEIGRHVLFHRQQIANGGKPQEVSYILDPGYWLPESLHIRTDIKALGPISYVIGVHAMQKTAPKTGK